MDYSEWLTPPRLAVEEKSWASYGVYKHYGAFICRLIQRYGIENILEMGCGTGWVPTVLPADVEYKGVDANARCVGLARAKVKRRFVVGDIRTFPKQDVDLVCSFAVLKHFAIGEWADVVGKLLQHGRWGLFSMPITGEDRDDLSQGFAHTMVSRATLEAAIMAGGHRLLFTEAVGKGTETMVATERA